MMEIDCLTPAVQSFIATAPKRKTKKPRRCWGILIDTREQLPYDFAEIVISNGKGIVPVQFRGLKSGDYSLFGYSSICDSCNGSGDVKGFGCSCCWGTGLAVEDFSHRVAVERKSLSDLYGSLGQERERFEREIVRLNEMEFAAVVIEAAMPEVFNPCLAYENWHSQLLPKSVVGSIIAWGIRYPKVHWFAAGSRAHGEMMTYLILEMFFKELIKKASDCDGDTNEK